MFLKYILPHLIGFILIVAGWAVSIIDVGLDRFTRNALMTNTTYTGLGLILLGAYFPEIYIAIGKKLFSKKD